MRPDIEQWLTANCHGPQWPPLRLLDASDDRCVLELRIEAELPWFEGHFPGQPVLAGVVQTHWVGLLAPGLFGIDAPFSAVDNLKFQRVIMPGETLRLELKCEAGSAAVRFRYFDDQHTFSSGKMLFAPLGTPL